MTTLRNVAATIRTLAWADVAQSQHHAALTNLDDLISLADRLVASCNGTIEHGDLPRRLQGITSQLDSREGDRCVGIDLLKDCFEAFLKLLLDRLDPIEFQKRKSDHGFTLHEAVRLLGLLSEQELGFDWKKRYELDPVARCVFVAKRLRNPVSHDAPILDPQECLRSTLVAMLFAVAKHFTRLQTAVRGLFVSPINTSTTIDGILRLTRSERARHLTTFTGREAFLAELNAFVRDVRDGTYILITAPEGFGKSALASKISDLASLATPLSGVYANDITAQCPWLPGSLFHSGKQESDPTLIVESLRTQANTMLVRPILSFANEDSYSHQSPVSAALDRARTALSNRPRHAVDESSTRSPKARDPITTGLRVTVHNILERLAQERGNALLIIDSLDEIHRNGGTLSFLPDTLPPKTVVLLTSQRDEQVLDRIRHLLHPVERTLPGLSRAEVTAITGLSESDDVGEILRTTQGAPLLVRSLADSLRANNGDLSAVRLLGGQEEFLRSQSSRWRSADLPEDLDPTWNTLLLLAIFEPVCALDLDHIQGYLRHIKIDISRSTLRNLLAATSSQLDGLTEGRIRLGTKALATYALEQHCGTKGLRILLGRISEWLAEEEDLPAASISSYLNYWTDPDQISDGKQIERARRLVGLLIDRRDTERLLELFLARPRGRTSVLPCFKECLRSAAEMGNADAMGLWGHWLVQGIAGERDATKGESLLRTAIHQGHRSGIATLGDHLCSSEDPTRQSEGYAILKAAVADGDVAAAWVLLMHVGGKPNEISPNELEPLLEDAIKRGSDDCRLILGLVALRDGNLLRNSGKGVAILRDLAEQGDLFAMGFLGNYLLGSSTEESLKKEGESLLRRGAEKGDPYMMMSLAGRLLDGAGLAPSPTEGRYWLERAEEKGDLDALTEHARRLLAGEGIEKNPAEAIRKLRSAAKQKYAPAQYRLSLCLLEGIETERSVPEGRRLLFEAADSGFFPALCDYGRRLLEGDGFSKDEVAGEKSLLRCMDLDEEDTTAHELLATYLLGPNIKHKDPERAAHYLRRAIRNGGIDAKRILGCAMIDGAIVGTQEEGLELLRSARSEGDLVACEELVCRLLEGKGIPQNAVLARQSLAEDIAADRFPLGAARALYVQWRRTRDQEDMALIVKVFLASLQKSPSTAGNNLGYLVRRGEAAPEQLPSLKELFAPGVKDNDPFARINEALRLCSGIECQADWMAADEQLTELWRVEREALDDAKNWWLTIAKDQDDPEGHLVLAWLARHSLISDPDGRDISNRLTAARRKWTIPDWMNSRAQPRSRPEKRYGY